MSNTLGNPLQRSDSQRSLLLSQGGKKQTSSASPSKFRDLKTWVKNLVSTPGSSSSSLSSYQQFENPSKVHKKDLKSTGDVVKVVLAEGFRHAVDGVSALTHLHPVNAVNAGVHSVHAAYQDHHRQEKLDQADGVNKGAAYRFMIGRLDNDHKLKDKVKASLLDPNNIVARRDALEALFFAANGNTHGLTEMTQIAANLYRLDDARVDVTSLNSDIQSLFEKNWVGC